MRDKPRVSDKEALKRRDALRSLQDACRDMHNAIATGKIVFRGEAAEVIDETAKQFPAFHNWAMEYGSRQ